MFVLELGHEALVGLRGDHRTALGLAALREEVAVARLGRVPVVFVRDEEHAAADVARAVLGPRQTVHDGVIEIELRHRPDDGRDGLELGLGHSERDNLPLLDQPVEAFEVLEQRVRGEDLADLRIIEERADAVEAGRDRGPELGVELRRLGLEPELDGSELVVLLAGADPLLPGIHCTFVAVGAGSGLRCRRIFVLVARWNPGVM